MYTMHDFMPVDNWILYFIIIYLISSFFKLLKLLIKICVEMINVN